MIRVLFLLRCGVFAMDTRTADWVKCRVCLIVGVVWRWREREGGGGWGGWGTCIQSITMVH